MASSGTLDTSSYDSCYFRFSWSASQVSAGVTKVTWTYKSRGKTTSNSSCWKYAKNDLLVGVNGASLSSISGNTTWRKVSFIQDTKWDGVEAWSDSGSFNVTHTPSGSAYFTVSNRAGIVNNSWSLNKDTTFYLDSNPYTYTVTYNANGGTGAPSSQTKTHGVNLTLSSTKPTRDGYNFSKWNTNSSGTGTSYDSGGTYSSNSSVTLYAVWSAKTYTIKYDANGGTGAPSSQTKTHGVNLTLSSTKPTRASTTDSDGNTISYTFKGWATTSSATTAAYSAGGTYTANSAVTLYAVWSTTVTENKFDVVFNGNADGVTNIPSAQEKTKGTALTLSSTKPNRSGYTFKNWNTKSDGSGTPYNAGASYTTDADIILYAIWTPYTHTITFNINGGSGSKPSNLTATNGVALLIPETPIPTITRGEFSHWNTSSTGKGGQKYYPGDGYPHIQNGGTVTLYAIYKKYEILFYSTDKVEATEFIESSGEAYLRKDGSIIWTEFIEGQPITINGTTFYCEELIER